MSLGSVPPALIGAVDDWLQKQQQGKPPQIGAGQSVPPPSTPVAPSRIGAPMVAPDTMATGPAPKIGAVAPVNTPQPVAAGATPQIGSPQQAQPDYAARYHDWAASEPAPLSPDAGKPSTLRKIGGITAGALIGALNPRAGGEIGSAIIGAPRHSLEMEQQQKEQQWERQGKEIQTESGLANTQSEIQERQDKPALERAKEIESENKQQATFKQQQELEDKRETAQTGRMQSQQAASEKGRQESETASERRTQEQIAASDRRTDKTIAAAETRAGVKETPFDRANAEAASKDVETGRGADFRYRSMAGSLPKAKSGDQQAMLNLLTNHIGMTLGMQKGARITKDILHEAQKSAPWLQSIEAKFDSQGYLSGVTLTPQQMDQMMGLAESQRSNAWAQAIESARQAGVADKVKIPADVRIRVMSPDGKAGTIPGSQLSQAEDAGYTVAPQ